MSINIDKEGIADVFSSVISPQAAMQEKQSIFDKVGGFIDNVGGLVGKVKEVGIFNNSTPQATTAPSGETVLYEQGKPAPVSASGWGNFLTSFGKILEDGAQKAGQVLAVREANKDLNENPPWNVYAIAVLGLAGLYIVLNRKG